MEHKVKIITHLRAGHLEWVEERFVKPVIAIAKHDVQKALKPGQAPGGSAEDNEGNGCCHSPTSTTTPTTKQP